MTIVEIGANVGYYTLLMASRVGERGKCYAFEANPEIFELLFRNVEVNGLLGRVTLENKAVLDRVGTLQFYAFRRHMGSSTMVQPDVINLGEKYRDSAETILVDCVSLDQYFEGQHVKLDLLKIDAEGSEGLILRGAKTLLRANPDLVLVMEWAPDLIRGTGEDPSAMLDFLTDEGFKVCYIDASSEIKSIDKSSLLSVPYCELLLKRNRGLYASLG
jgi:FkbM family methyltransferase